jgi:hypothetical protein
VIGAVAITMVNLAGHYQPLTAGNGGAFSTILAPPGLPAGQGIREVNTLGGLHEDFYVPPQRGTFWLLVDVENEGPEAVTIKSIRVPPYAPLWMAGTARYAFPSSAPSIGIPAPTRTLRDLRLGPGQAIFAAIPVRTTPCGNIYGWVTVPAFDVTFGFGPFTRTAAMGWGQQDGQLVMRAPEEKPVQGNTVCATRSPAPVG